MDDCLYYVKVYEDGDVYKYEYGNLPHAMAHYEMEKSKGNKVSLFRYKDGKMQKYQAKANAKCNCGKCKPTAKPKKIMPISRARKLRRN